MSNSDVAPITLTAEQIISLVGHGVTQEQLDGVRRELGGKIDDSVRELNVKIEKSTSELNAKIDKNTSELNTRLDRLDDKVDSKFNLLLGVLFTNIAAVVGAAVWVSSKIASIT